MKLEQSADVVGMAKSVLAELMTPIAQGKRLLQEKIQGKWGLTLDPDSVYLVSLRYRPNTLAPHPGTIIKSETLTGALLSNWQDNGSGVGWLDHLSHPGAYYSGGPQVRIVNDAVDNLDNVYEGIYSYSDGLSYGAHNQLDIPPADFEQLVWSLDFSQRYHSALMSFWQRKATEYRLLAKAGFLTALSQQHDAKLLSDWAMQLAVNATGMLEFDRVWHQQLAQESAPTSQVSVVALDIYGYKASDILLICDISSPKLVLYVAGERQPFSEFSDLRTLQKWLIKQILEPHKLAALSAHFSAFDRQDGVSFSGVDTALRGMLAWPKPIYQRWGDAHTIWSAYTYIHYDPVRIREDIFTDLTQRQQARSVADAKTSIRSDSDVTKATALSIIDLVSNTVGPFLWLLPLGEIPATLLAASQLGLGLERAVHAATADERGRAFNSALMGGLNSAPAVVSGVAHGATLAARLNRAMKAGHRFSAVVEPITLPVTNTVASAATRLPIRLTASERVTATTETISESGVTSSASSVASTMKNYLVSDDENMIDNTLGSPLARQSTDAESAHVATAIGPSQTYRAEPSVDIFAPSISVMLPMDGVMTNGLDECSVAINGYSMPVIFDQDLRCWRQLDSPGMVRPVVRTEAGWRQVSADDFASYPTLEVIKTLDVRIPRLPLVPTVTENIPKVIHYIWLGSHEPGPELLENIIRNTQQSYNASAQLGYASIVHTDLSSADALSRLRAVLAEKAPTIVVQDLNESSFFKRFHSSKFGQTYRAARYGPNHNYSAASDVLRYLLLHEYGGIYLDVDDTIKTYIAELDLPARPQDVLVNDVVSNSMLAMENAFNTSNFASHAGNSVLQDIAEECHQRFMTDPYFFSRARPILLRDANNEVATVSLADAMSKSEQMSQYMHNVSALTGPGLFNDVLRQKLPALTALRYFILEGAIGTKVRLTDGQRLMAQQAYAYFMPFSKKVPIEIGNTHAWEHSR